MYNLFLFNLRKIPYSGSKQTKVSQISSKYLFTVESHDFKVYHNLTYLLKSVLEDYVILAACSCCSVFGGGGRGQGKRIQDFPLGHAKYRRGGGETQNLYFYKFPKIA